MATLCAKDTEILSQVDLDLVCARVEKFMRGLPFHFRMTFWLCLFLLEYAIFPLVIKWRPLSWMEVENQLEVLGEWQNSRFHLKRMVFEFVKRICLLHLFSEPKLMIHLGFESSLKNRAAHVSK